jgi:hypothetical protein
VFSAERVHIMGDGANLPAIVRTCVLAGRPELIESALIERQHAGDVATRIERERAAQPVARTAPSSPAPASGSIFSEPTPAQRDALTKAVRRRFDAMAPKSGG